MTDTTKPDACRVAFNKEFGHMPMQDGLGDGLAAFLNPKTQGAWEGWQAAWNARAPVAALSAPVGYISRDGLNRLLGKSSRETAVASDAGIKSHASHSRTIPLFLEAPAAQQSADERDIPALSAGERAIQRAAAELPEGFEMQICIEKDAGWIELHGNGEMRSFSPEGETMTELIHRVIDAARASTGDQDALKGEGS